MVVVEVVEVVVIVVKVVVVVFVVAMSNTFTNPIIYSFINNSFKITGACEWLL